MFRSQKAKLSADELKSKLYAHFDKSGSLNKLRTQLRSHLVSELFKISPPTANNDEVHQESPNLESTLLPLQVCNWLIHDHLLRKNLQYSLSTFVSETNLPSPNKLLSFVDILRLFGLDSSNPDYKQINDLYSSKHKNAPLHSLLFAIIISLLDHSKSETSKHIEENYYGNLSASAQLETNRPQEQTVNDFINHQKQSTNIPETHISSPAKSSYDDQLQSVKEESKKEMQKLRQKLLEELERLHSKEHTLQLELEQEKKEIRKERDSLFKEKEKLKEKEIVFLKEHENKLEKKIYELDEINVAKLHRKDKEIENLYKRLQEKEENIGRLEYDMSSGKERFDSLKRELEDVNNNSKIILEKYTKLLDQNTSLVRKFENMSDYDILKEEVFKKSKEISCLKQDIEKILKSAENDRKSYTDTVTNLELKLRTSESKLHQLEKELGHTRNTLQTEEALWNREQEKFQQEAVESKELYQAVLQRIEEQKQDIQDLHQTMHILHYQLSNKNITLPSRLENDIATNVTLRDILLPSKNKSIQINNSETFQQYKEDALSFTADYKSRFNKLQKEMEAGFNKYSMMCYSSSNSPPKDFNFSNAALGSAYSKRLNTNIQNPFSSNILAKDLFYNPNVDFTFKNDAELYGGYFNKRFSTKDIRTHVTSQSKSKFLSEDFSSKKCKSKVNKIDSIDASYAKSDLFSTKISEKSNFDFPVHKHVKSVKPNSKIYELHKDETSLTSLHQTVNVLELSKASSEINAANSTSLNTDIKKPEDKIPSIHDITVSNAEIKEKDHFDAKPIETTYTEKTEVSINVTDNLNQLKSEESNLINVDTSSTDLLVNLLPEEGRKTLPTIKENVLVAVDLEAAWRRKSLPPVVTPSLNNNFVNNINEHPDSVINVKQSDKSISTPVVENIEIVETTYTHTSKKNYNHDKLIPSNTLASEIISVSESHENDVDDVEKQKNDTESKLSDDKNTDDSMKVESDASERGSFNIDLKQTPEESLSELSEVRMSCGSEQEQKEDSDNW